MTARFQAGIVAFVAGLATIGTKDLVIAALIVGIGVVIAAIILIAGKIR